MSEAVNLSVRNDENDDIYKDIGDFHLDRELAKLEECNKAYSEDIERLSAKIKQLTESNNELKNVNDILTTNISILLKTAKAEIQRKQLVIDELRKKTEDSSRGSNFKEEDLKNLGVCKVCGSKFSKYAVNDLEDGEIVKDNNEDDAKSEVGSHRNFKSRETREHSGNRKKKKRSHERSRGRSSDKYSSHSHRSSRRSDESRSHRSHYSHHSHRSRSSRSRPRYKSPDERRHYSSRRRSREKKSHSSEIKSDYSFKSSSQKREYVPLEKEIHWRSEESHRSRRDVSRPSSRVSDSYSKVKSPAPRSYTKSEKNSENTESSCRPASASENKTNASAPDSNVMKSWTQKIENNKTEVKSIKKSEDAKKFSKSDYHERKSDNGVAKKCENNLFTRQSVLADLYNEPMLCNKFPDAGKPKNSEGALEYDNHASNCVDSSSDESWTLSFGRKPRVLNKPKTLYSQRMESRLKQNLKVDEMNSESKCGEYNRSTQDKCLKEKTVSVEEEKEEGEISFEKDQEEQVVEDAIQKNKVSENTKEPLIPKEMSRVQSKPFADKASSDIGVKSEKSENPVTTKDSEQSVGGNVVKKLFQFQKKEETSVIKVFSPLKNNYKLSKISPLKFIQKQHILEYYDLKPAQQLNNIEPEILDCSFSVPETPGKNVIYPFSSLDSQEPVRSNEKEETCAKSINNKKEAEGNRENDSKSDDVEEAAEDLTVEKDEKRASPEDKKLGKTRTKRKLGTDKTKEKQIDSAQVTSKNEKNVDEVNYQIRTRSRSGNDNRKCIREVNDSAEKRVKTLNKETKSVSEKRKRTVSSEDEEVEEREQKQMKRRISKESEMEESRSRNEKTVEKEPVNEKGPNESKRKDTNKGKGTYFEVFPSVLEATNARTPEEKDTLEELSLSNASDCTGASCIDTPSKLERSNGNKLSLMSAGNSRDTSTFKVLRSYLMLSVNEESDVEAFSEDSTCSSGEYSDSGASAFVDLL